jgi:hypothetical protein
MQHLEDSGTPVLYIGRTVLRGKKKTFYLRLSHTYPFDTQDDQVIRLSFTGRVIQIFLWEVL